MRIEKDSLVKKIIDYNAIAIIVTSIFLAMFLVAIVFTNIDDKVTSLTREKGILLKRVYDSRLDNIKNTLFNVLRDNDLFPVRAYYNAPHEEEKDFNNAAKNIYDRIVSEDSNIYKNSAVSIVSEYGNVLGKYGNKYVINQMESSIHEKTKGILAVRIDLVQKGVIDSYTLKLNDDIYTRTIYPAFWLSDNPKKYIVLTIPLKEIVDDSFDESMGLEKNDKLFVVSDKKEQFHDFIAIDDKKQNGRSSFNDYSNSDLIFKAKDKNNDRYYIVDHNIYDYSNKRIGSVIVGVNRARHIRQKIIIALVTLIIVLITIIISNSFCRRVFYSLLRPLSKIVEAAENVSKGNYKIDLDKHGVNEINNLSSSFEKMVKVLQQNEEDLTYNNKKLMENLHNLDTIEKILMGINIEDEVPTTVKEIMLALTSEIGLGYSRAMYFRYSRELDTLVGEDSAVNNILKSENLQENDQLKGFKFQIYDLEKLVKLIKVPFKEDTLLGKSIKERRALYFNDKGHKYNIGNDLFKSMGIENFMIFPIYSNRRNYGCILIDNFNKNRLITKEDEELITLLFIDMSIKFTNKALEEEKIDKERIDTVGKLSERFLSGRESAIEKILSMVERMDVSIPQVDDLKKELLKINKEISTLRDYSEESKSKFEAFSLEEPIKNAVKRLNESLLKDGITLSVFMNQDEKIFGDKKKIERVFVEIIKNAQDALNYKNDTDKKINIVITQDKHIDKARISIKDNGIGMREDQLKNIFDPFVSYSNSSGLGLAIVNRIIKDHSGVVKIKSEINKGTELKITLNLYKEE